MKSPLRPQRPDEFQIPQTKPELSTEEMARSETLSHEDRVTIIRQKMEKVANEYANREISRAQFNAIYGHYSEQRTLIERIIARNPQSEGWRQAAADGKTDFLRAQFEARPTNYIIYLHRQSQPLMGGGTRPDMNRIAGLLRALWSMDEIRTGVARLALKAPFWLIMAAGQYSVTFVTFQMEPSGAQATQIRDLHNDFERANRIFLERGRINKAQMVFPQRSLLEDKGK